MEILSFYRSSNINIKEPPKQTSQIIQNFNLILAEWKLENKRFQNNRNKIEKRARERSNNFWDKVETNVELPIEFFTEAATRCVLWKKLFLKLPNIHWKPSVLESLIKRRVQHRCFLMNIAKFLKAPILTNICERLFLVLVIFSLSPPHFQLSSHKYPLYNGL